MAKVQVAFDRGYGHRSISHDRTNPYDEQFEPAEHEAWEQGWQKADAELSKPQ